MIRSRRGVLIVAGVSVAAALCVRAPNLRATDYKKFYLDRVIPTAPPPPAPHVPTREELAAMSALLREDLVSWHAEVFGPLAFTNRTCVRMRQTFMVRNGRAPIMREDVVKLQRQILSVRDGMLTRARAFVPRTENIRALNQLLCRTLDLHVSWMTRVTEQQFDVTLCPAPPELVAAKKAFTAAFEPYRRVLRPSASEPDDEDESRDD